MARRRRTRRPKAGLEVSLSGADPEHLKDQEERFALHYAKHVWEIAIVPTADRVEEIAKQNAPKLSGFMADTIEQKEKLSKNRASIKIRPNYRLYEEYFYAPVQEWGSSVQNIPATRYMWRAKRAVQTLFAKLMRDASREAIRSYKPLTDEEKFIAG